MKTRKYFAAHEKDTVREDNAGDIPDSALEKRLSAASIRMSAAELWQAFNTSGKLMIQKTFAKCKPATPRRTPEEYPS